MLLRKIWSALVQVVAIAMIIYLVSFKSDITAKDVVTMMFWCTMFLIEEIRQIKWNYETDQEEDNNNN